MRRILIFAILSIWATSASAQAGNDRPGLLVMAHGGSAEWNEAVAEAVLPLRESYPVSVAFGMADPVTLQASVDELAELGAKSIGVVRLFVSGASFIHETEYAFRLREDPPTGHMMHHPVQLAVNLPVLLSHEGLMDVVSLGGILSERALALSTLPEQESVLILGHGPADDIENEEWLRRMDRMADSVRAAAPFHRVVVNTLREDWTGKREVVEKEIRAFVSQESDAGRTVLVVPFRLFGFGPYAEVLGELDYRADSTGFLPDRRITTWIDEQYQELLHKMDSASADSTQGIRD